MPKPVSTKPLDRRSYEFAHGGQQPRTDRKKRSFREAILGILTEEHMCAPPDATLVWVEAVSTDLMPGPGIYVCPECGMCWHATGARGAR